MTKTERRSFRTYLAYLCMRTALWLDVDWVQYAAMTLVKQRVERYLHERQEELCGYEEPEPEYITVTYH